jgi:predicted methyltransferase
MRTKVLVAVLALAVTACTTTGSGPPTSPATSAISAAVADAARPAADSERDGDRKPAQMLVFSGVKPGSRVVDLIPGGGYFTRLFSVAVGTSGRVYAYVPDELTKRANRPPSVSAIAADPHYANVSVILKKLSDFSAPEQVDVVFTAQNYHDLYNKFLGPADVPALNRAVFRSLKPGGVYVIIDHSAVSGAGTSVTETLHRIEAARVKADVEAAGFVLEAQDQSLVNAADSRKVGVFDPSIRGHTDQFVYRFRKPKSAR